ncbi:phytoene/squalene synthase family protein [Deinococcus sp.]|uniref:phytoene/squalene synthase family protein n=1 Tax=Deinococcus sp. TaxID=47478 RepID=UPI0025BFEF45|nr:phytoene/squalene synthase family protein [Deinococcus sp.]
MPSQPPAPPTVSPPNSALAWCREVTRIHSHTFYRGSLLYPRGQREAVWAVYAACRVGDDIADSGKPLSQAQTELDGWWAQVQAAHAGKPGQNDMELALAWAFARYPVPLSAFAELYAGFCMDLAGQQYATLADLELYCRRVAGVVGFMIAPIGGYRGGDDTLRSALALGKAMQLTNILRDVGEDLRLGRLYLPAELLAEYGVNVGDLKAGRVTSQYQALVEHLTLLAHEWYAQGWQGVAQLEGRARYGVAVAARLYAGILEEVRANDYDNLTQRAHVSGRRKLWLTVHELHKHHPRPGLCPLNWVAGGYARLRSVRP